MAVNYRLGLDIGTNSIGWWRYALDGAGLPVRSLGGGARIFSDGRDPQDKTSLASKRRLGRSMRRRRDRYLRRRTKLVRALIAAGLFPQDDSARKALASLDPYELRAAALDRKLAAHELGRVFFHLNQRRGFKSNRRTDRADSERGIVRQGVSRLRTLMEEAGAKTLGQFLWRRKCAAQWVRARKRPLPTVKGKLVDQYDIYPDRAMVEAEFDAIWRAQAQHHPSILTDEKRARLKDILFFQRRLKPTVPGKCWFNPEEDRLPWCDPLSQRRRIFEQVNQLRIIGPDLSPRELTRAQRDAMAAALLSNPKRTFTQLRRLLKLAPDHRFNLESERRPDLKGDETATVLADPRRFGAAWRSMPLDRQRAIVTKLWQEEDEQSLAAWLMAECGLDGERAFATSICPLPDGYASLGETATRAILRELEADVVVYSAAARRAGYHHSDDRTGEIMDAMPYYGQWLRDAVIPGTGKPEDDDATRYGRVSNPTVHIGLGQLRRVVNDVIAEYGAPAQIVVELARELKANMKQREEMERRHDANRNRAIEHRKILAELGLPDSGENRLRLRLYDELAPLEHRCPYSGTVISRAMLFGSVVDIDHILPFSLTLDNRVDNRILVLSEWNRTKGDRTPYDAFHHTPHWADIAARAERLPAGKRWRFQPDALDRFRRDEVDFLARHLTDTQYLSRLAKRYLSAICNPDKVYAIPGGLTSLIRGKWRMDELLGGGNVKNRNDHRHHALDAAVIGLVDRGLLNRIAHASGEAEKRGELDRIEVPMPWAGLKDELKPQLSSIVVSHKPEHGEPGTGSVGKFFKDTAYGIISPPDKRGVSTVVHRVPLLSLKSVEDIEMIRGDDLRRSLLKATAGKEGKELAAALAEFRERAGPYRGLRRVRVTEKLSVMPIADGDGRVYKGYASDGNFSFIVWRLPNGRWDSEVVPLFDAARAVPESAIRSKHPTAKKIMTLRQGDLVALETADGRKIMRVVKFSTNRSIQLAEHYEAGNLKARDADRDDYFKYTNSSASGLQKSKARKLRVTPAGRLFDPGPRE